MDSEHVHIGSKPDAATISISGSGPKKEVLPSSCSSSLIKLYALLNSTITFERIGPRCRCMIPL